MTFPSLPTDSLYKFLFVSGVVLFIFSYIIGRDNQYKLTDKYIEKKNSLIKYSTLLDKSLENYNRKSQELLREINSSFANTKSTTTLVNKTSENISDNLKNGKINRNNADSFLKINDRSLHLLAKANKEIKWADVFLDSLQKMNNEGRNLIALERNKRDSLNEQWHIVTARLEGEVTEMQYCKIIGIFLSVIGLIGWIRVQNVQDKILYRQLKEAIKEDGECQSCGMVLKYGSLYNDGNKYCHHCFDGEKYVDPELKLHELKNKVRARMKEQGFGKFETWIKVRSLNNLERWKRDFRW